MKNREIMRQKGRTFFWAARFLHKNQLEEIYALYLFCRFVDDLVDLENGSCCQVEEDLKRGKSDFYQVQNLLNLAKKGKLSLDPAKILVNTLEEDCKEVQIQSWEAVIRYCYGVASTVGLMLCDIFDVKDPNAYPFAIDLGIAMQLTNIARDILEDAKNNKLYLPQEAFAGGITTADILKKTRVDEVIQVQEALLQLADRYYASADRGMHYLPLAARASILVASRLYQAKGETIRKDPHLYLDKRADVGLFRKMFHTVRALSYFAALIPYRLRRKDQHDPSLHRHLFLLPGTNPCVDRAL